MTLRLQIDPGGEKFFSFAQKKLQFLKDRVRRTKLPALTKHFKVSDSETVWVNTTHVGHDVFLDWIRIKVSSALRYLYAIFFNPTFFIDSSAVGTYPKTTTSILYYDSTPDVALLTGTLVTDTVPPGGYSWYALPGPGFGYGAYISGTQPMGAVGVGRAELHTYTNYPDYSGGLLVDITNGQNQHNNFAASDPALPTAFDTRVTVSTDLAPYADTVVALGMLDDNIKTLVTADHPTFPSPPTVIFADGELITLLRVDYVYVDDTAGDPHTDAYPDTRGFASISAVQFTAARQYRYKASDATWSFVKTLPVYTLVGDTYEVTTYSEFTWSTYDGNIVVVSENARSELDATYTQQMQYLAMTNAEQVAAMQAAYRQGLEEGRDFLLGLGYTNAAIDAGFDALTTANLPASQAAADALDFLRLAKKALFKG